MFEACRVHCKVLLVYLNVFGVLGFMRRFLYGMFTKLPRGENGLSDSLLERFLISCPVSSNQRNKEMLKKLFLVRTKKVIHMGWIVLREMMSSLIALTKIPERLLVALVSLVDEFVYLKTLPRC